VRKVPSGKAVEVSQYCSARKMSQKALLMQCLQIDICSPALLGYHYPRESGGGAPPSARAASILHRVELVIEPARYSPRSALCRRVCNQVDHCVSYLGLDRSRIRVVPIGSNPVRYPLNDGPRGTKERFCSGVFRSVSTRVRRMEKPVLSVALREAR
jgi:hypothetical protein